jgi:TRAP-type mannitol/chloroaromatic compound transport system substrate-binding protein
MGFHKVAPYYYTGWHEPGSELQFLINLKKYNTLPKDLQTILIISLDNGFFLASSSSNLSLAARSASNTGFGKVLTLILVSYK